MASWFFSCMSQSSWTLSAQWWMVRITGLVSKAPGGPQLTTGLSTVWTSSTGGLEKADNKEERILLKKSNRRARLSFNYRELYWFHFWCMLFFFCDGHIWKKKQKRQVERTNRWEQQSTNSIRRWLVQSAGSRLEAAVHRCCGSRIYEHFMQTHHFSILISSNNLCMEQK